MPAIETNRANANAAIEAGTLVSVKPANPAANSPGPALNPYPQTPNPYIRTPLPAISTQQPDQQRNWQSGSVPQERLIGIPLNANPVISAQTITNVIKLGGTSIGSGVLLQVNGKNNPNQLVADFIAGANISISSDSQGGITIGNTAASGGTNFIPLPNSGLYFEARAVVSATNLQTIGATSTATATAGTGGFAGGASSAAAGEGIYVGIATGATLNSQATWFTDSIFWIARTTRYQCRFRFPTSADTTSGQTILGFASNSDLRPPAAGVTVIAFRNDYGTWKGVSTGGVTITLSATPDTLTHDYEIILNQVANTATFFIDGVSVGSTNIGATGFALFPVFSVNNTAPGTTAGVTAHFQYMYAQQDF